MERLDKFVSTASGLTRSQVKDALKAGRVTVDGRAERDGGRKIQGEQICLDGQLLGKQERTVVMLHKPAGFVTANKDDLFPTVMELLPAQLKHLQLNPVGRLDKETEGLLLFTDDGELLHRLISPKSNVKKIYLAHHEGEATEEDQKAFREGLELMDGTKCLPAELEPLGPGKSRITVREGKYHQVRRMMASRNMHVTYLQRVQEGNLTLKGLPLGQVRHLSVDEIDELLALCGGVKND